MSGNFLTAIHLMSYLAYKEGRDTLVTSDELAGIIQQNPVVVRRLISRLREAGLVDTVRGKAGGFRLNRSAADIDLLSVFTAIEGENPDLFSLGTMDKRAGCSPIADSIQCTVNTILQRSLQEMKNELTNHSLDGVLHAALGRLGMARQNQ